jgi:hypothetical protein
MQNETKTQFVLGLINKRHTSLQDLDCLLDRLYQPYGCGNAKGSLSATGPAICAVQNLAASSRADVLRALLGTALLPTVFRRWPTV